MRSTADEKYLEKVRRKAGKAINQYHLINENDRILVGVSGGKDSLSLLEILALRRRFLPINYHLEAVHINITDVPYSINRTYLSALCESLSVPLHYIDSEAGIAQANGKSPCFLCSWNRRKALFELAQKLACNKLATGHHMDDALETMLMNMTYHGEFSSMPPSVSFFEGKVTLIRPLILNTDHELQRYATIQQFPEETKNCPWEDKSKREHMRELVGQLCATHKLARTNLFKSMSNINTDYLPPKPDTTKKRK